MGGTPRETLRDRRGRTPLRLLAAGAVAPLLLVGLAGCQGDEQPAGSSSAGSSSPGATASSGPLTRRTLVPALEAAVRDHPSAHIRTRLTGTGPSLTAEGDIRLSKDPVMAIDLSGPMFGNKTAQMRLVDGFLYLSIPPLTPEGKFVRAPADDPQGPFGAGIGDLTRQMDPRKSFDAVQDGLRKVEYLGKEPVAGERLAHYRLTVDAKAATKAYGPGLMRSLPDTIDYDLWLDDQNLVRRLTLDLGKQGALEASWSRWGEPVTVQAPAKADVIGTSKGTA